MTIIKGQEAIDYKRMNLHQRIKVLLFLRGITTSELASRMGISRTFLYKIFSEKAKCPAKRARQMCEILEVSESWLKKTHIQLNKYNDPTENERFDIDVEYAEEVSREDADLIWCDTDAETRPRVIFDNAGGVTLDLPEYAHYYEDAGQAGYDATEWYFDPAATKDWDGNQPEIAGGNYDESNNKNLVWLIGDDAPNTDWGGNVEDFFTVFSFLKEKWSFK